MVDETAPQAPKEQASSKKVPEEIADELENLFLSNLPDYLWRSC